MPPFLYRPDEEIGTNWAGNYHYKAKRLHVPEEVSQVQELVKKAKKVRVLGSRHCFNSIADSPEDLVSLKNFKEVVSLDKKANTVTVGAGVRYGDLASYLHKNGYALHNLASLPHISIAGACATATHGSGVDNGNLATAISGMEIITANGELQNLSKEIDGEQFNGSVVGLGGVGAVTKVTLDIEPTYNVEQYVYRDLPVNHLEDHFDEIMSSAYSVSLFTDFKNNSINQVWIKNRLDDDRNFKADETLFDARLADRHMHPIADISAENCTRQMGMPGPWHERLPHFRMNFTPSSGDELQSEFFVPHEHAYEAISEIYKMSDQVAPHLLISEIRTIDADDLWMSPCYNQPSVTLHFTWKPDWESVRKVLPDIEKRLAPYNVRPHWGKLFTLSPDVLQSRYEKLSDFKALLSEYDPEGKFRNDFLQEHLYS
ncbi:FAD-binding protein [Aliifodinibius sp. S!AR15-10]|uniref:FAD-binding protein n=1 Tax=Aliifodinibius sp. S!AR15-10 TaxID=2950437 RepID=UPI00286609D0|nr:FAD-binding protein [Aliifodinibius sp. S!AR15-10]MDR8392913.1 FAD-binding protein [Aliifodinibius sp. S!AR15-10]